MSEPTSASNTAFFEGVTTSDASARVQKVPVPVASPGACILCGKYTHPEGFAFFGLEFEFYGTLYFCGDCVGDIASTFGWLPPDRVTALLAEHEDVLQENINLGDKVKFLEEAVDSLTKYRAVGDNNFVATIASIVEQVESPTDEQPELEFTPSTESSVNEQSSDESDVSEPVSEQGTDDVPSTTGDESTSSELSGPKPSGGYLDIISEFDL